MSARVFANQLFCPLGTFLHNLRPRLREMGRDLKFQQDFLSFYERHFASLLLLIKIDYIFNTDIEES